MVTRDGGRVAARGFQYQYLRTVEALVASVGSDDVAACRVEGPADATCLQDVDAVDFDLCDTAGKSLIAVQVKSAGAGREVRARDAISVLVHLVVKFDSRQYQLITSAVPSEGCLRLAQALREHQNDIAGLQAQVEALLARSPKVLGLCRALTEEQWRRFGRAAVEFDSRDDAQIREDLNGALRRERARAGRGLAQRSGGLVLGYLVSEVMRRAADPSQARWDVADFQRAVLMSDGELFAAAGNKDFGLVYGQTPYTPDVERAGIVDRLRHAFEAPEAGHGDVAVCAVTGLSGVGKSSLAAAYIADQAYRYDAIFWVDAESEESLTASFSRVLAHLTDSEGSVELVEPRLLRERVHARLQSLPGPWLMVFDDARTRPAGEWIPRHGSGQVIVTSVGGNWRKANSDIELGTMASREAVELVRLRLTRSDGSTAADERTLTRLADTLENWPLAIEVACGYLASCEVPGDQIPAYIETLVIRSADDQDSVPAGYPRTLAAAVSLSLDRLVEGARAKRLLQPTLAALAALCWLGPRRVPVHLALAGALDDPEDVPGTGGWVVFNEAHVPVREMVRELRNVSLVRYDEPLPGAEAFADSEDTISMNAVLQQILAQRLGLSSVASTGLPRMAFHTGRWLRGAMETGQAERAWELAQHATVLVQHIEAAQVADRHTALLMGDLAAFQRALGRYDAADQLLEMELECLRRAGDPDPGLAAQAHCILAGNAQLHNRSDASEVIAAHLRPVLAYVRDHAAGASTVVSDVATEASLILQTRLRVDHDAALAQLLDEIRAVADGLPETEVSRTAKGLVDVNELLRSLAGSRAEQAAAAALAQNPDPWAATTADLKRLHIEALVVQDKWEEANAALDEFLPYTGPKTLYGFAVHHLVHNVGLACAWKWVVTGEPQAVQLLRRLFDETSIRENAALETSTDHARFILLRAVVCGWQAIRGEPQSDDPLELMRQLTDKTFTDPHLADSAWERIYTGLLPRLSAVLRDKHHGAYEAEASAIIAASGGFLQSDPLLADPYAAASCHMVLALSTDTKYGFLAGESNLDLLLPEARLHEGIPRALVILQPKLMIGATSCETGKSIELQLQRACSKGLRHFVGPMPILPAAGMMSLKVVGGNLLLEHDDGTIVARASTQVSQKWRSAARSRGCAVVIFGFGLSLHDHTEHDRLFASPAEVAEQVKEAGAKGLLAGGIVPVQLEFDPDSNTGGDRRVRVRNQPRRSTRSGRRSSRQSF